MGSQTTSQIIIDTGEYVLISDSSGGGPGGGGSSDITTWVKAHGTAVDGVSVGSGTLYAVTS